MRNVSRIDTLSIAHISCLAKCELKRLKRTVILPQKGKNPGYGCIRGVGMLIANQIQIKAISQGDPHEASMYLERKNEIHRSSSW